MNVDSDSDSDFDINENDFFEENLQEPVELLDNVDINSLRALFHVSGSVSVSALRMRIKKMEQVK